MSENLWNEKGDDQPRAQETSAAPASAKNEPQQTQEGRLIEKLVMSLGAEQRRSRRWGIFFKSLTFIYLFALLFMLLPDKWPGAAEPLSAGHTALIEVQGTIAQDEEANADDIAGALQRAFKDEGTRGVIIRINSPGGSPVQSGYIFDEVRRLKAQHPDIGVYSVIGDIGASGGYYIAAAADEIYADKASLVGSIGVVSSSFGFVEALDKLGVERRLMTAGENKAFLDPFLPLKSSEKAFWKEVLETTHRQFIAQVKKGRGERLKEDAELFTGLVWTGEQALALGLVDGLGSAGYVAREVIGEDNIVDFTPAKTTLERLTDQLGVSVARTLAAEFGIKAPVLR